MQQQSTKRNIHERTNHVFFVEEGEGARRVFGWDGTGLIRLISCVCHTRAVQGYGSIDKKALVGREGRIVYAKLFLQCTYNRYENREGGSVVGVMVKVYFPRSIYNFRRDSPEGREASKHRTQTKRRRNNQALSALLCRQSKRVFLCQRTRAGVLRLASRCKIY